MTERDDAIAKANAEADAEHEWARRVQIAERALQSVCAQFRIQIASLKRDKARLRSQWSSIETDHWTLVLAIKEWESRTGKDHNALLKGDYHNPYGDTND
jgi:hypothetical protein